MSDSAFQKHRVLAQATWDDRARWDAVISDCYEYGLPTRRHTTRNGQRSLSTDRLFDMTAPTSVAFFAGNLQRDLFPSGHAPFTLETGALARAAVGDAGAKVFDRELDTYSKIMFPFFQAGDWDTAIHETCFDLAIGTGAIMPIAGDDHQPVIFASIPFDQLAISCDAWGRPRLVSWRQDLERFAIVEAFPAGDFPEGFVESARTKPNEKIELYQDFIRNPAGRGWSFIAYIQGSTQPIITERYATQPIAVPRYYRLNGEAYGFGPLLTALPSIKTLNKAQELALKSAAIGMLGIWGYRSGGTFNPDTSRLAPGEFWPMQATGGVLGPDVSRLDTPTGNVNVAGMLIGDMQSQIKSAMFDTRLPDYSGTPRAASEIVARMRQKADVHIGAFGRLVHEIMPVIVPRVAEILYTKGILRTQLPIDQLMLAIRVQSPMAAALNAERLASIAQYFEIIGALAGPDQIELYGKVDRALELMADGMQVDKSIIPTPQERQAAEQRMAQRADAQIAMQAAGAMANAAPQMLAADMQAAA